MLYFKILKNKPESGADIWAYEKHDPSAKTADEWVREIQMADGKVEVTEEEYLAEVAEGTEGRVAAEEPSEEDSSEEQVSPEEGGLEEAVEEEPVEEATEESA